VRGAFTGADKDREGVFEYADKGTLFLDEIGDMPLTMQPKLLRVLETGDVVRLGSNENRKVDVRLVSATNRDLKKMSSDGQFREDLFFRIKGAEIHIPPLRDRREDVPLLVNHAVGKYSAEIGRARPTVTQPAMMRLVAYDWPGNVREVFQLIHRRVGLDKLEKEAIRQTLAMTSGNRELTAQMLGIGERTLYRKLKEYGLR